MTFLRNHRIEHGRRKILHFNVTPHPTAEWVVQQLREAFPDTAAYRYLILDHDSKFDAGVLQFLKGTGLQPKRTSIEVVGRRYDGNAVAVGKQGHVPASLTQRSPELAEEQSR